MAHSEVKTYFLTEEERLAYIEKYPIRKKSNKKGKGTKNYKWKGNKAPGTTK